ERRPLVIAGRGQGHAVRCPTRIGDSGGKHVLSVHVRTIGGGPGIAPREDAPSRAIRDDLIARIVGRSVLDPDVSGRRDEIEPLEPGGDAYRRAIHGPGRINSSTREHVLRVNVDAGGERTRVPPAHDRSPRSIRAELREPLVPDRNAYWKSIGWPGGVYPARGEVLGVD